MDVVDISGPVFRVVTLKEVPATLAELRQVLEGADGTTTTTTTVDANNGGGAVIDGFHDGFANGTQRVPAHFAALANRPWQAQWDTRHMDARDYTGCTPVDLALRHRSTAFLISIPVLSLKTALRAAVLDLLDVVALADRRGVFSERPESTAAAEPPPLELPPAMAVVGPAEGDGGDAASPPAVGPYPYAPARRVPLDTRCPAVSGAAVVGASGAAGRRRCGLRRSPETPPAVSPPARPLRGVLRNVSPTAAPLPSPTAAAGEKGVSSLKRGSLWSSGLLRRSPSPRRVSWAFDLPPATASPAAQPQSSAESRAASTPEAHIVELDEPPAPLQPIVRRIPADRLRRAPRVLEYLEGRGGVDWARGETYPLLTAAAPVPELTLSLCPGYFLTEERIAPVVMEVIARGDGGTLAMLLEDARVRVALRRSRAPIVAWASRYLPKGFGWMLKKMLRLHMFVGPAYHRACLAAGSVEELHRCAVRRSRKHHASTEQGGAGGGGGSRTEADTGTSPAFSATRFDSCSLWGSFNSSCGVATPLLDAPLTPPTGAISVGGGGGSSRLDPAKPAALNNADLSVLDGDDDIDDDGDNPHASPSRAIPQQIPGAFLPDVLCGAALCAPGGDVRRRLLSRDPWASVVITTAAGLHRAGASALSAAEPTHNNNNNNSNGDGSATTASAVGIYSHPAAAVKIAPVVVTSRIPWLPVRMTPPQLVPLFRPRAGGRRRAATSSSPSIGRARSGGYVDGRDDPARRARGEACFSAAWGAYVWQRVLAYLPGNDLRECVRTARGVLYSAATLDPTSIATMSQSAFFTVRPAPPLDHLAAGAALRPRSGTPVDATITTPLVLSLVREHPRPVAWAGLRCHLLTTLLAARGQTDAAVCVEAAQVLHEERMRLVHRDENDGGGTSTRVGAPGCAAATAGIPMNFADILGDARGGGADVDREGGGGLALTTGRLDGSPTVHGRLDGGGSSSDSSSGDGEGVEVVALRPAATAPARSPADTTEDPSHGSRDVDTARYRSRAGGFYRVWVAPAAAGGAAVARGAGDGDPWVPRAARHAAWRQLLRDADGAWRGEASWERHGGSDSPSRSRAVAHDDGTPRSRRTSHPPPALLPPHVTGVLQGLQRSHASQAHATALPFDSDGSLPVWARTRPRRGVMDPRWRFTLSARASGSHGSAHPPQRQRWSATSPVGARRMDARVDDADADAAHGAGTTAQSTAAAATTASTTTLNDPWVELLLPKHAPALGSLTDAVIACDHPLLFAVLLVLLDAMAMAAGRHPRDARASTSTRGHASAECWHQRLLKRRALYCLQVFVPVVYGGDLARRLAHDRAPPTPCPPEYLALAVGGILTFGAATALDWKCLGPIFAVLRTTDGACAQLFHAAVRKGDASVRWLLERYPKQRERAGLNDDANDGGDGCDSVGVRQRLFLEACARGCTTLLEHHFCHYCVVCAGGGEATDVGGEGGCITATAARRTGSADEGGRQPSTCSSSSSTSSTDDPPPDPLPLWLVYRGAHTSLALGQWATFRYLLGYVSWREAVEEAGSDDDDDDDSCGSEHTAASDGDTNSNSEAGNAGAMHERTAQPPPPPPPPPALLKREDPVAHWEAFYGARGRRGSSSTGPRTTARSDPPGTAAPNTFFSIQSSSTLGDGDGNDDAPQSVVPAFHVVTSSSGGGGGSEWTYGGGNSLFPVSARPTTTLNVNSSVPVAAGTGLGLGAGDVDIGDPATTTEDCGSPVAVDRYTDSGEGEDLLPQPSTPIETALADWGSMSGLRMTEGMRAALLEESFMAGQGGGGGLDAYPMRVGGGRRLSGRAEDPDAAETVDADIASLADVMEAVLDPEHPDHAAYVHGVGSGDKRRTRRRSKTRTVLERRRSRRRPLPHHTLLRRVWGGDADRAEEEALPMLDPTDAPPCGHPDGGATARFVWRRVAASWTWHGEAENAFAYGEDPAVHEDCRLAVEFGFERFRRDDRTRMTLMRTTAREGDGNGGGEGGAAEAQHAERGVREKQTTKKAQLRRDAANEERSGPAVPTPVDFAYLDDDLECEESMFNVLPHTLRARVAAVHAELLPAFGRTLQLRAGGGLGSVGHNETLRGRQQQQRHPARGAAPSYSFAHGYEYSRFDGYPHLPSYINDRLALLAGGAAGSDPGLRVDGGGGHTTAATDGHAAALFEAVCVGDGRGAAPDWHTPGVQGLNTFARAAGVRHDRGDAALVDRTRNSSINMTADTLHATPPDVSRISFSGGGGGGDASSLHAASFIDATTTSFFEGGRGGGGGTAGNAVPEQQQPPPTVLMLTRKLHLDRMWVALATRCYVRGGDPGAAQPKRPGGPSEGRGTGRSDHHIPVPFAMLVLTERTAARSLRATSPGRYLARLVAHASGGEIPAAESDDNGVDAGADPPARHVVYIFITRHGVRGGGGAAAASAHLPWHGAHGDGAGYQITWVLTYSPRLRGFYSPTLVSLPPQFHGLASPAALACVSDANHTPRVLSSLVRWKSEWDVPAGGVCGMDPSLHVPRARRRAMREEVERRRRLSAAEESEGGLPASSVTSGGDGSDVSADASDYDVDVDDDDDDAPLDDDAKTSLLRARVAVSMLALPACTAQSGRGLVDMLVGQHGV